MSRLFSPCNFSLIPFVSASKEVNETASRSSQVSKQDLQGEEASLFYSEILSLPSAASVHLPSSSKQQLVKPKKVPIATRQGNKRLTIFHHAQEGNVDGIEFNISEGYDVDAQDLYGWTPLMCATFEGHYPAVEYLVKRGANIDIKNKQGQTALDFAIEKNYKALIKLLRERTSVTVNDHEKKVENEGKFCSLCNSLYSESRITHQTSIAHLLCCKKNTDISTYYCIPENNKGFQIMLKKGWDKNKGLGINSKGRKFPIKTVLKIDRTCIGGKKEVPRITHFGPKDYDSVKKCSQSKVRVMREKTYKKKEILKMQKRDRQKEINFRRQFNIDN